ncbi:MAG: DMT family transporter [Oscillochloris sp.]|nr:DMT family transporter [Oscillochloris sp.]
MGIIFGLLAALGWGGGDFMISRSTRVIGPFQTMFYVQLAGIGGIMLVLLLRQDQPPTALWPWVLGFSANLFNLVGTMLMYRAFAVGTLSIVSPITASFAVVTMLLALLGGERPGALALAGTLLVIAGVLVVSRGHAGAVGPPRGVPEALGSAICFGCYFWAISFATPLLGIAWPVLIGRLTAILAAWGLLRLYGSRPVRMTASNWWPVLAAACFDTTALLCYNAGIASAYVSIVTALASIFSAVTVLLAWAFLRERLHITQWAGVAGLLVGVLMVSL